MAFELKFDVNVTGAQALDNVSKIMEQVGAKTKLSAGELRVFEGLLKAGAQTGQTLSTTLTQIAQGGGVVSASMSRAAQAILEVSAASKQAATGIVQLSSSTKELAAAERAAAAETRQLYTGLAQLGIATGATNYTILQGVRGVAALTDSIGLLGVAAIGGVIALGLTSKAVIDLASGTAHYAQEIYNAAQKTGLGVEQYQQLALSAEVAGVNAVGLTTAMRTLSRGLSEGTEEGKKQKLALSEIGIQAEDSLHRIRPLGELLPEIYKKLGALPEGPQRDFFANTILGRGGIELVPLLGRLDELGLKVSATGAIMDSEGVSSAAHYAEQLNLLGIAFDGLKHKIGLLVIPSFSAAITAISNDLSGVRRLFSAENIIAGGLGLVAGASTLSGGSGGQTERNLSTEANAAAGTAAANTRIAQFQSGKSLQEKLKDAERQLSVTPVPELGKYDSPESADAAVSKYRAATDEVERLKNAISAAKKEARDLNKEIREDHQRETEIRGLSGAGEDPKLRLYDRYLNQSSSALFKGRPDDQADLLKAYQQGYAREEDKEIKRRIGLADQLADESGTIGGRLAEGQEKATTKQLSKLLYKSTNNNPLLPKYLGNGDPAEQIRILGDQERQQDRQVSISGQINNENPIATAQKIRDLQLDTQKQQYVFQQSLAVGETDAEQRLQNAKEENARRIYDINAEYQDRLLEKYKSDQSVVRGLFSGGFSALVGGGGKGLGDFLKGQALGVGSTIAGNIGAELVFPKIASSIGTNVDPNSTFGKILKNTPFAPKTAGDTLLIGSNTANTAATIANTAALQQLYASAISASGGGGSASGGGLSGISGDSGAATGTDSEGNPVFSATGVAGKSSTGGNASPPGIFAGLAHTGDLRGIFTGVTSGAESLSTSERIGAGIGTATALYGAERSIAGGVRQGGAGGLATAAGSAAATGLGLAAAFTGGPSNPLGLGLTIAAAASSFIGPIVNGILGDPRASRQHEIDKEIGNAKFEDPIQINQTRDQYGNYADANRFGDLRQSPFSAVPIVTQSTQLYRGGVYEQQPGGVNSPYGGAPGVVINVTAMDSKSFTDHSADIIGAVTHGIAQGQGDALSNAIRYQG